MDLHPLKNNCGTEQTIMIILGQKNIIVMKEGDAEHGALDITISFLHRYIYRSWVIGHGEEQPHHPGVALVNRV